MTKASNILTLNFIHCNFITASKHLTDYFKNSPTLDTSRPIVDTHSTTFATHQSIDVKNTKTLVINSPILAKHSPVFVKNTPVFVKNTPVFAKNSPVFAKNTIAFGKILYTTHSFSTLFINQLLPNSCNNSMGSGTNQFLWLN
ncbi:MAG: hypothetical protein NTZ59_06845 [Bacteroidetes bacterium]|nr:hypothetical protein [Bacteroidota bacterium]